MAWLTTAPMDLFNANHAVPRHSPGTRCKYNPKESGPGDEFMYVKVTTSGAIAPTQRRLVYALDSFNGTAVTSTTGATEVKPLGALISPTVTSGYYTWIKTRGKSKVAAYGTFTAGQELMADASGYLTDRAGDASYTAGIAIGPAVGANAGAATSVYVDLACI